MKNRRQGVLIPPVRQLDLRAILDLWMLRLEEEYGTPREDLLLYFRYRLLAERTMRIGDDGYRLPVHPDELDTETLFTFMWRVSRLARRQLDIELDFNMNGLRP